MLRGKFDDKGLTPWVVVSVRLLPPGNSPKGDFEEIECIVDTGFSGYLQLPTEKFVERAQDHPTWRTESVTLANGEIATAGLVDVESMLGDTLIEPNPLDVGVRAHIFGREAMIGTRLLHGFLLVMSVKGGGHVTIKGSQSERT